MLLASTAVSLATDVIDAIGVIGVACLIAIESIIPPIPSELVLLFSGFLASDGRFAYPVALAAATVGSVAGAWLLYAIGATIGEERMEALLSRFGRPLGIRRRDIERANEWFERQGGAVVFFGRLVPLVRSFVSLPAGTSRMAPWRFTLYTTAGSLIWNSVWLTIGFALGDRWEQAERWTSALDYGAFTVIAAGVTWLLLRKRRERSTDRTVVEPS
jgi:membrane protein DedA with SNARE-associated domain